MSTPNTSAITVPSAKLGMSRPIEEAKLSGMSSE